MTTCRFERLLPIRLRRVGGTVLCLLRAPGSRQPDAALVVLIASPRPPYLRRWRLYPGARAAGQRSSSLV